MMLRFAAVAAALVMSSAGCSMMNSCGSCGDTIGCTGPQCPTPAYGGITSRGPCQPGLGICDRLGWTQRGCAECVDGCGGGCGLFGSGCCGGGQCGGCNNSCLQNCLGKLLDCNGCQGCGDQHYNFTPGPPTGQVAYPYYTTRGPRDFLMANPPSIGPR